MFKAEFGTPDDDVGASTMNRRGLVRKLAQGLGAGALLAGCAKPSAPRETKQGTSRVSAAPIRWKTTSLNPTSATDYPPFVTFCANVAELSEGQLTMEAHGPNDIAPVRGMFDALKAGTLDLIKVFPPFANFIPSATFLTSYPLGLDRPDQWETWYYGLGGLELARRIFSPHGVYFVGPVQHDLNVIHTRHPVRSFEDFKGLKIRMPGGLIAEVFDAAGAKTVLLTGDQVYPALKSGAIDAADFAGPATNFNLGFASAAKYILVGPTGTPCIHQPADIECILVNQQRWDALSKHLQNVVEYATRRLSWDHYAYVQKQNTLVWQKYRDAGVETIRLSNADVDKFRRVAIPLWFKYARKDPLAREAFASQVAFMKSPAVGYLTDDMLVDASGKPLLLD